MSTGTPSRPSQSQRKGFSPVWTRMCRVRRALSEVEELVWMERDDGGDVSLHDLQGASRESEKTATRTLRVPHLFSGFR